MFSLKRSRAPVLSPAEMASALATDSPPVIVDIRSPEDYAASHLPGAINIPMAEIEAQTRFLDLEAAIVFY